MQLQQGSLEAVVWSFNNLYSIALGPPGNASAFYRYSEYGLLSSSGADNSPLLFWDNFSDTSSGWPRQDHSEYIRYYVNGGYRTYNPPPPGSVVTLVDAAETGNIRDGFVEVDASRIGDVPNTESQWGVVCRANGRDGYYRMSVSSFGYRYIVKVKNERDTVLAEGNRSDAIRTDKATNHLRGECVGNRLTLYVNDQKLVEAEDAEFKSGLVDITVANGADEPPGTDILFDNFLVYRF